MTPLIKNIFDSRTKSFDSDISSLGVLPSIAESLKKFDLFITLKHGIPWIAIVRRYMCIQYEVRMPSKTKVIGCYKECQTLLGPFLIRN